MKNFVSEYLNTKVLYGGYIATRAEVIQDLRRIGAGEREIGLYMSGLKEWKEADPPDEGDPDG